MYLTVVLGLLFLVEGSEGRYPRTNEGRIKDYMFSHPNYSITDRPVVNDEDTVEVMMSLQIYAMLELNEKEQVITASSWITLVWEDHRLQWNSSAFGGVDVINVFVPEVWTPRIFISNGLDDDALGVISNERGSIILQSNGVASLGTPIVLETQCPINTRYFPFDTQACEITFLPEHFPEERVRLSTADSLNPSSTGSREWSLVNITNAQHVVNYRNLAPGIGLEHFTAGVFCIFLEREPSHYVRSIWIPSTIICLMSLVTFFAPPDCGERISLGVSMVLGLTVFQLLIADTLPTAGEDTPILSTYLSVDFALACLVIPVSLMNINIAFGDSRVFVLKYPLTRSFFLEHLPRMGGIPSYSQRIADLSKNVVQIPRVNGYHSEGNGDGPRRNTTVRTSNPVEDEMSRSEKIKLELRTLALVMDRLAAVVFLAAFLICLGVSIVGYLNNPGVTDDVREYCYGHDSQRQKFQ